VSEVEDKILQGYDAIKELEEKKKARQKSSRRARRRSRRWSGRSKRSARSSRASSRRDEPTRRDPEGDPSALFDDYIRIAKTRGGVAMAEAIDERCQVCMVRLRPQVYQELRMGDKLFHCESCRRILYFQQKEEAPAT
jgi:predicted  nucleic acid-binding Zn-ribbon protein